MKMSKLARVLLKRQNTKIYTSQNNIKIKAVVLSDTTASIIIRLTFDVVKKVCFKHSYLSRHNLAHFAHFVHAC